MLIPEKYRERYDNLARSHSWMREMRDEQPPEGDAVGIMRKAAKGFEGGTGHVMKNAKVLLGINKDSGCDSVVLDTLADMVERDYVRRGDYDFISDVLKAVCDERDELKVNTKRYREDIYKLIDERDEWKAKAEGSSEVRAGSSDDGARRSMTNLDALLADLESALFVTLDCEHCAYSYGPNFYCRFDNVKDVDYKTCKRGHREWLLSPHVDDSGQNADMSEKGVDCVRDGVEMSDSREKLEADALDFCTRLFEKGRLFAIGLVSSCDGSEQHDELIKLLDRQAAITAKQLIGESDAPKSEETVENDTSKDNIRNFDDSREKLEADVRIRFGDGLARSIVMRMLDRQEAIAKTECADFWQEITEDRDRAQIKCAELTAERDRYRDMCGQMLDAAQEIRRIADACMPEGGKEVM